MHNLRSFWDDESGSVASAELVLVGSLAAVGVAAGAQTVSTTLDEEVRDMTRSIRNLNQSYSYNGFRGCGSKTAGSTFADASNVLPADPPQKSPSKTETRKSARLVPAPVDLAEVIAEPAESDDPFDDPVEDVQESLDLDH